MKKPRYAELLCKSNYSFLRGASHPGELFTKASELGLEALAITDIGGVYGVPKAYLALKDLLPKESEKKLKLICGAEVPVEGMGHLTLLAQDRKAYGLMCRLLTEAHRDRPKADPLLTVAQLSQFMSEPESQGIFAIPYDSEAVDYGWYRDLFSDRLATPLFRFLDGRDPGRTKRACEIRDRFGIPVVASNDVHFHSPHRGRLQDVLTSIREGIPCQKAGFKLHLNSERYLKSALQMTKLFSDLPEAIEESARIADRFSFCPSELKYRYPSEWIPSGHTAQSYLESETWKGAQGRYDGMIPSDVERQIQHELKLVSELGFADYFLTVYDIVVFARARGILCQGRGSAANSILCYALGITAVDPVRMSLLFERFISAERGEPPDIDIDFEHERREEVLQYVYERYGRHRAAMVSAVITYRSRSALREVAKALGVEVGTLSAREVQKQIHTLCDRKTQGLVKTMVEEIRDFPRHLSIHSGGFTLSADPITEIVPVEPASMEGRTIIQWDKYDLDILGLLKVDLLSLGMLSAVRKTLELVKTEFHKIPADDAATYAMIQKADTIGVFQIESRAQMSMLPRLLPKTFYDLVVEVALVRPGPIVGKMVHPYLKRRRGEEPVDLPHPDLEPILGRTLGVPIFQEQVMKMAVTLAEFTPGEADQLRRAIGAWRSSGSIDVMGKKLMAGLLKKGVPREFAERVFEQIHGFSEYGFPEAHAASFALIAYVSAYLKCHHPAEFAMSLINSQPLGFYANHTLVDDAKHHGVEVLPVDPMLSQWDCQMEGKNRFRLGFRVVQGMSRVEGDRLMALRSERRFFSFHDFLDRTRLRRNILRSLASGDVFACFGLDQRNAHWALLEYEALCGTGGIQTTAQGELFSQLADPEKNAPSLFTPLGDYRAIQSDYSSFGLSVRGHPMGVIRKRLRGLPPLSSKRAKQMPNGSFIELAGMAIIMQRPPTAKGTVFATLEDEDGFMDLILWGATFEKYRDLILDQPFLIARGELQRDGNAASLVVRTIRRFQFTDEEEALGTYNAIPRSLSQGVTALR